jgi:glycosyltransferase involved in cell wall biosynthesis
MITVVMPSFLGPYPGAASNREAKLRRAINSFLIQGIGRLVIVADGCQKTIDIVNEYKNFSVVGILIDKQPTFSGVPRQLGINFAASKWICYLDSDDEFGPNHLRNICNNLDDSVDWLYYNDILIDTYRDCIPAFTRIGTSCIVHKKNTSAVWPTGYGHDWGFILQLGTNFKKIDGAEYIVNHIPNVVDK